MTDQTTEQPTTHPAGWYADRPGSLRWYDGQQWTEHTRPALQSEMTPARAAVDVSRPDPDAPVDAQGRPRWMSAYTSEPQPAERRNQVLNPVSDEPEEKPDLGETPLLVGLSVLSALLVMGIIVVSMMLLGDGDETDTADPVVTDSLVERAPGAGESTPDRDDYEEPVEPETEPGTPAEPAEDGSPEDVAQRFLDALLAGDCEGARELMVDELRSATGDDCFPVDLPMEMLDMVDMQVGEAAVEGDLATVPVEIGIAGSGIEMDTPLLELELTRVDGSWLLSGLSAQ